MPARRARPSRSSRERRRLRSRRASTPAQQRRIRRTRPARPLPRAASNRPRSRRLCVAGTRFACRRRARRTRTIPARASTRATARAESTCRDRRRVRVPPRRIATRHNALRWRVRGCRFRGLREDRRRGNGRARRLPSASQDSQRRAGERRRKTGLQRGAGSCRYVSVRACASFASSSSS